MFVDMVQFCMTAPFGAAPPFRTSGAKNYFCSNSTNMSLLSEQNSYVGFTHTHLRRNHTFALPDTET
jgi:hypothetical protein